jgi:protein TonB
MNSKKLLTTAAALFIAIAAIAALVPRNEAQQALPEAPEKPPHLRVSQGVMERNLTHKVDPTYPEEAKAAHIEGDVILGASVDREGKVSQLKFLSGHPLLVEPAMSAVKQWKYKPFLLNGQPVEVETTIKVQFQM